MIGDWGETGILSPKQSRVVADYIEAMGYDPLSAPIAWEAIVAQTLGGTTTDHKAAHDVDVVIWGRSCRAEVKFSAAYFGKFEPIRGVDWSRNVFKWSRPRGMSGKYGVDACILIGRDIDQQVYLWIVPVDAIAADCASITVTAPSSRKPRSRSMWDEFQVPWSAMLPAFAAVCHNTYDMPMRRRGIAERAKAAMAHAELFAIATAAAICIAQGAWAHDWYTGTKNEQGQLCCGGYDCTTVPYDAVRCDAEGCDVTITPGAHPMVPPERFGAEPRVFRFTGTPSVSPDLSNHACITKREAELGIARCVWIGSGS